MITFDLLSLERGVVPKTFELLVRLSSNFGKRAAELLCLDFEEMSWSSLVAERANEEHENGYVVEESAGLPCSQTGEVSGEKLVLIPVLLTREEISKLEMTSGRALSMLPSPLSMTDLVKAGNSTHKAALRVAYQGIPGAYSEAAALKAYSNCDPVPCDQFDAAFQAVELWLVDRAVLPVENSLGGSIHRNYDLLMRHKLHIVGEVQLAVHHCLMALPGVQKEQLKRVVSHQQALAQCEGTLTKLGVVREAVDDTAGAAQFIAANNLQDTGAVASARAAEIYGLNVLADGIQDDPDNVTRFLMLAREPIIPKNDRPFKTSIVFTLHEGPGELFKALAVFSLRNINLTKIESRPQRKRPLRFVDNQDKTSSKYFDYLFYVDFEASMADTRTQNALGHLQSIGVLPNGSCASCGLESTTDFFCRGLSFKSWAVPRCIIIC
ncbi:hypothetical protein R1flu_004946 [Riccia fluitans]|uniref:Arogenate dehydratase n=1 Tax=Riccia fluitans TaxID=41844 RepID=A0ABD1YRQ5_9MARC